MKVCIPFHQKGVGGSFSFLEKFTRSLEQKGITITTDIHDEFDRLFLMSSCPLSDVIACRRRHIKIIQRLDGVYYYRVKKIYPLWNARMKIIHQYLADHIIYQGHFSKFLCQRFLGKPHGATSIVPNGVDLDYFSPKGEKISLRPTPDHKIFVTVGSYRREDMLLPLLRAVENLRSRRNDFTFLVIGPITKSLQKKIQNYTHVPYVQFLGSVPNHQLPTFLRSADLFFFSDISACPNVVIEAQACGLPVVAFDRGGIQELVNSQSGMLIPHTQNELWRLGPFDIVVFSDAVETLLDNLPHYKAAARENALSNFSLEKMVQSYRDIIEAL